MIEYRSDLHEEHYQEMLKYLRPLPKRILSICSAIVMVFVSLMILTAFYELANSIFNLFADGRERLESVLQLGKTDRPFQILLLLGILCLPIAFWIFYYTYGLIIDSVSHKRIARNLHSAAPEYHEGTIYRLNDHAFRSTTENGIIVETPWAEIDSYVVQEQLVILFDKGIRKARALPLTSVDAQAHKSAIVALLAKKLGEPLNR